MNKDFLLKTLQLAKKRRGFCAPNPSVGAVIVKNNKIIAEGYHFAPGHPHAETVAIEKAGEQAKNSTLYVSLEPCSHRGRTPPCVEAIIAAKIQRIFFAYKDPNPAVSGNGQHILQQAGIPCEHFSLPEINAFYRSYHHWVLNKKPSVTAKIAVSLDGKIGFQNKPAAITHEQTNAFTHRLRRSSDAILTSINTVLNDDPQLNARCNNETTAKNIYVLDRQLQFPFNAQLVNTAKSLTLFHDQSIKPLNHTRIRCIGIPIKNKHLELENVLDKIGNDGIHDLWVEVGSQYFNALLKQQLIDEVYFYLSPKILGDNGKNAFTRLFPFKAHFQHASWQKLGKDLVWHFVRHSIDKPMPHC